MSEEERKICPRCGMPFRYIRRMKVSGKVYLYAVHVTKVKKKEKKRLCYLGPEGSYEHGALFHEKLGLKLEGGGKEDKEKAIEYLFSLLEYLRKVRLEKEEREEVAAGLRSAIRNLKVRE
jgi:protein-arginine kinase activator protein McsA